MQQSWDPCVRGACCCLQGGLLSAWLLRTLGSRLNPQLLNAFCMPFLWPLEVPVSKRPAFAAVLEQGILSLAPAAPADCSSLPLPGIMAGPHHMQYQT